MAAISSQELPIMGYSGFPVTTVNEMRYIEAKECGLTALMQSFTTAADARRLTYGSKDRNQTSSV